MKFYPPKIDERCCAPRNAGKVAEANACGTGATFICGAAVRFSLRIEQATKTIADAKFQTNGCGYAVACADLLAETLIGETLTELHGLNRQTLVAEIEGVLGKFAAAKSHCLDLALDAVRAALVDYRRAQAAEFAGERALICTCFGVSEDRIEKIVADHAFETVEEVTRACRAGDGCGACRPLIQEIIDIHWRERF